MARQGQVAAQALRSVFVITFASQMVYSELHSLRYIYSAYAGSNSLIKFVAQGLLDDVQIDYYDNHIRKKVPKQPWMNESLEPGYWERGTQSRNSKEHWFKVNNGIIMQRRNDTSGRHTLQWVHGCSLGDDIKEGFDQYAYDGRDFLSFNKSQMQWVAVDNYALQTREKWDAELTLNQYTKRYLEQECIEWLNNFLKFSNGNLKKVNPETNILRKRSHDGKHTFSCHASNFFPSTLSMTWIDSKTNMSEAVTDKALPNYDNTFQTWLDIDIELQHAADYVCQVNHGNFTSRHLIPPGLLKPEDGVSSIIVVVVVMLVVVVFAVMGVLVFRKRKGFISLLQRFFASHQPSKTGDDMRIPAEPSDNKAEVEYETIDLLSHSVPVEDETASPLISGVKSEDVGHSSSSSSSSSSGYSSHSGADMKNPAEPSDSKAEVEYETIDLLSHSGRDKEKPAIPSDVNVAVEDETANPLISGESKPSRE